MKARRDTCRKRKSESAKEYNSENNLGEEKFGKTRGEEGEKQTREDTQPMTGIGFGGKRKTDLHAMHSPCATNQS